MTSKSKDKSTGEHPPPTKMLDEVPEAAIQTECLSVDDAINRLGPGVYQWRVFVAAGLLGCGRRDYLDELFGGGSAVLLELVEFAGGCHL